MSQKPIIRRRIPANRRIKPPQPSPPPSTQTLHRQIIRRSSKKPQKSLTRCNSEPTFTTAGISISGAGEDEHRNMTAPGDSCLLFRNRISSSDIFSSSPELMPNSSPEKSEGYNKESKVVIKVMVEGSVGPIRTLVKLGSSVDETIKLVMNKYNAERRSPRLDHDDLTSFELHHSYFSLQCLDKSNMIGEIGSRSFYMRKSVNDNNAGTRVVAEVEEALSPCSSVLFPGFIYQQVKKMIEMSKIRRFLSCFGG